MLVPLSRPALHAAAVVWETTAQSQVNALLGAALGAAPPKLAAVAVRAQPGLALPGMLAAVVSTLVFRRPGVVKAAISTAGTGSPVLTIALAGAPALISALKPLASRPKAISSTVPTPSQPPPLLDLEDTRALLVILALAVAAASVGLADTGRADE